MQIHSKPSASVSLNMVYDLLTRQPETLSPSTIYHLPSTADALALIITRVDPNETTDPVGSYTVTLLSAPLPAADLTSP